MGLLSKTCFDTYLSFSALYIMHVLSVNLHVSLENPLVCYILYYIRTIIG
jgi:hypothetical protein